MDFEQSKGSGWLSQNSQKSQNLWALITGVGVLIYTYFMTKARGNKSFEQPLYRKDRRHGQYQSCIFFLMSIRFVFHHFFFFDVRFSSYHFNILLVFFVGLNVGFWFVSFLPFWT